MIISSFVSSFLFLMIIMFLINRDRYPYRDYDSWDYIKIILRIFHVIVIIIWLLFDNHMIKLLQFIFIITMVIIFMIIKILIFFILLLIYLENYITHLNKSINKM